MNERQQVQLPVSSYKELRLPKARDKYFRNALEWIEGNRSLDHPTLWRIHDKLYNLKSFIKQHPGGSEWISSTIGTDITEAFESSHFVNLDTIAQILRKYYVRDANTKRASPFTFKDDGFYRELKRRAEPVLKKHGTGPSQQIKLLQDGLAASYVVTAFISVYWNSFPLQLFAGLILGLSTVCAHSFFHIKDNWRKYYFDLAFVSSFEWRLGHALSHHLFPNTVMDYELYLFEPFMELSSNKPRSWSQKYLSHFYLYVLYSQVFNFEMLKRVNNVFFRRVQAVRWENFIVLAQFLGSIYIMQGFWIAFLYMFVVHSTASFYFSFVGTATASHHHPESFHEGDPVRSDTDFGLCQLDVIKESIEPYAHNMYVAATTFGEHPLHHLFPTVCHSKLKFLQPVVEEVLREYKEGFKYLPMGDKFKGIHYQLVKGEKERQKAT